MAPQPYRDFTRPLADKLASGEFVIVAADTIGEEVAIAKEGLVTALVGQRPFEMGYKAPSVMLDLIAGNPVEDPVLPRRMHQGHRGHLHPEVGRSALGRGASGNGRPFPFGYRQRRSARRPRSHAPAIPSAAINSPAAADPARFAPIVEADGP
jgi:hypothetical protein